jgi:DNA replication protein DnaC
MTMPSTTKTPLADQLVALGLRAPAAHLNDIISRATTNRWSPTQILEHVVQSELDERARRGLERRLSHARLGRFKPMADFDWAWPKKIDRDGVESALRLDFAAQARNVVLVAPQGLGKTMIAQNIGHQALLAGHSVRFVTASQLLLDLAAQDSARALDRRLRHYGSRTAILIVDEIGYLSYDSRNADLLFQIVSRRHEKRSLVLTTNLAFRDWPTIFPNAGSAVALIDRLIHHADVLAIEGESYRLREAEQALKKKAAPKRTPKG